MTDLKDDEEPEGIDSSSEPSNEATEDDEKPAAKTSESGKGKATATRAKTAKKTRSRGGLGLFLREVIAELRKVVRPTRQELWTYTTVVIVFVLVIMVLVSALDFGIAKLIGWAFGGA